MESIEWCSFAGFWQSRPRGFRAEKIDKKFEGHLVSYQFIDLVKNFFIKSFAHEHLSSLQAVARCELHGWLEGADGTIAHSFLCFWNFLNCITSFSSWNPTNSNCHLVTLIFGITRTVVTFRVSANRSNFEQFLELWQCGRKMHPKSKELNSKLAPKQTIDLVYFRVSADEICRFANLELLG